MYYKSKCSIDFCQSKCILKSYGHLVDLNNLHIHAVHARFKSIGVIISTCTLVKCQHIKAYTVYNVHRIHLFVGSPWCFLVSFALWQRLTRLIPLWSALPWWSGPLSGQICVAPDACWQYSRVMCRWDDIVDIVVKVLRAWEWMVWKEHIRYGLVLCHTYVLCTGFY